MGDSSNTSDWYWILTVPPQSFDTFETKSPSTNPTVNTERICTIKISWHTLRQKKHLTIPFHAFAKVPIVGFHQCFGKIFHHEATLARHQTSSQQAICWSIDVLQSSAPKLGNPAYVYRLLMTCWGLVMSKNLCLLEGALIFQTYCYVQMCIFKIGTSHVLQFSLFKSHCGLHWQLE